MFEQLFGFTLILLLLSLTATAFAHVVSALFPRRIEAVVSGLDPINARTFWLGLANTVLVAVLVLGLLMLSASLGQWIALPSLFLMFFYAAVGLFSLIGFVHLLGQRLFPDASPFRRNSYAAVILCLACITPYLGWFLLFPFLLIYGFGGYVQRILQRRRQRRVAKAEEIVENA